MALPSKVKAWVRAAVARRFAATAARIALRPTAPWVVSPGIAEHQNLDFRNWQSHKFGLSPARWARLSGQRVWITGAGTGFGQAVAVGLACAGAKVVLTGRRPAKLEETVAMMRDLDAPGADLALLVPCDITDPTQVEEGARAIASAHGGLEAIIPNAGTFLTGLGPHPLADMSPENWDFLMTLNVKGQWLVTKAAIPLMVRTGTMRATFITSEAGWAFTPSAGPYNVSKAALNSLGASFAAELAQRYPEADVQFNVVLPGEARTEMNRGGTDSPFTLCPIVLQLLSHPVGGPNGRFFYRDGRHFPFAYAEPWPTSIAG